MVEHGVGATVGSIESAHAASGEAASGLTVESHSGVPAANNRTWI